MAYDTMTAWMQIAFSADFTQTVSGDLAASSTHYGASKKCTSALGTGAAKANLVAGKSGALVASTPLDIDISGGWTDPNGVTIEFAKIKALAIFNTSDELDTPTACVITVSPSVANGWDAGPFGAGSEEVKRAYAAIADDADGWIVTAGTGDSIELDPGALAGSYKIVAIGERVE